MGVLTTGGSLLITVLIVLTLTCATLGFASQTLLSEETQTKAMTQSALVPSLIKELSSKANITLPESTITLLVTNNVPRITSYLADTSSSLDLNLSIPDTEFTTLFGTLPACQPNQSPMQKGKLICRPNIPVTLLSKAVANTTAQATQQAESNISDGFSQAKQALTLFKKITWITFILSLLLLAALLALNHAPWSSALAWVTVALGCAGFLTLAIAVLTLRYAAPALPADPAFLHAYLLALLTAVLSTLKIYSLIILGIALTTLGGSFYLKSK